MKLAIFTSIVASALLAAALNAHAGDSVVFERFLDAEQSGRYSNTNPDGTTTPQQVANRLRVPDAASVTQVRWNGSFFTAPTLVRPFRVRFFDGENLPNQMLAEYTVDPTLTSTGEFTTGREVFEFAAVLDTPFLLQGGERYWISIVAEHGWFLWSRSQLFGGVVSIRAGDGGIWGGGDSFPNDRDCAFALIGQFSAVAAERTSVGQVKARYQDR